MDAVKPQHFNNLPTIEGVADENSPNVRKAQASTQSILSQAPTEDPRGRNTACHVPASLHRQT